MPKIRPVNAYILIEPEKIEEKTTGGIIIPNPDRQPKPQRAKVIAVAPFRKRDDGMKIEMPVKKGDDILCSKCAPDEIRVDNEVFYFIKDRDVIAILSPANEKSQEGLLPTTSQKNA